ncbi:MAG TPA: hypothetical protein VJJ79_02230, partial [Candidatus Nanoarchaeia archaeon]|nr:hypothetical protein [Candidatus Nanoarchaeia archaeon]
GIRIDKKFYTRNEAEQKFGVNIYQGGIAPGKMLRIVDIKDTDVEACGGTHLDNTAEAEKIRILSSSKIQDGIVRITFVAGNAATQEEKQEGDILGTLQKLLKCERNEIPWRAEELFILWKDIVKKKRKREKVLVSHKKYAGDVLAETAKILQTQPAHIVKTVQRFLDEMGM